MAASGTKPASIPTAKPTEPKPAPANAGAGIPKNTVNVKSIDFADQIFLAFKILGLEEKQCQINEITKAWRKLALKYHPDKKTADPIKYEEVDKAYNFLRELYQPSTEPCPPPPPPAPVVKPAANVATPFKDIKSSVLALPNYSEDQMIATILAAYEILNLKPRETIEEAFKRYVDDYHLSADDEWYKFIDTCRLLLIHAPNRTIEDDTLRQWATIIIQHTPALVDKYVPKVREIEGHACAH
jgi:hypothetical protein